MVNLKVIPFIMPNNRGDSLRYNLSPVFRVALSSISWEIKTISLIHQESYT